MFVGLILLIIVICLPPPSHSRPNGQPEAKPSTTAK
jgi:hypothetical protein